MAVYFVYRCYDIAPSERQVRRFECDNVLDWFRSIWTPIPDEEKARQHARELFGGLDAWMFGEGLHELLEYDTRVRGVTAEQMRDIARKYFDPEKRVEGIVRGVGKTV